MATTAATGPRRVLLTGGGGFVAPYFVEALAAVSTRPCDVLATGREAGFAPGVGQLVALDITDTESVSALVADLRPDAILHLAGISDLAACQADPAAAWRVNVEGTLNFARALHTHSPGSTFIFAGSCQVYGASANLPGLLNEDHLLSPISEYGATKAAADLALGYLAARGLRTIRFRPFNHIGPGQSTAFAIPSFAAQIALIEQKRQAPKISVGNLEAARDFLDVRDVARAYALALVRAESIDPGTVLNVASGNATVMRNILDTLIRLSGIDIEVHVDSARWRPNEIARLAGDSSKASACLDWKPCHRIEETLGAVLDEQRRKLAGAI